MKTCGWTDRSPPLLSTVIVSIWIQWTKRSELTRGWLVWNKKYSISNKWNEIEPNKYSISNKRNEIEPNKGLWINFRGNGHFIMMVQFYSVCERPRIFVEISFCLLWFHQYFLNKVIHEVKCSSKYTCVLIRSLFTNLFIKSTKIDVHKYWWNQNTKEFNSLIKIFFVISKMFYVRKKCICIPDFKKYALLLH